MIVAHPHVHRGSRSGTLASVLKRAGEKVRAWSPGLTTACAGFHVVAGLILAFAPLSVILSQGTKPVLDITSKEVWGLLFIAVGVMVFCLHQHLPRVANLFVRSAVLLLGGMWFTAFLLAVLDGEGNALGLAIWPFLYGPWLVAMHSLGKR